MSRKARNRRSFGGADGRDASSSGGAPSSGGASSSDRTTTAATTSDKPLSCCVWSGGVAGQGRAQCVSGIMCKCTPGGKLHKTCCGFNAADAVPASFVCMWCIQQADIDDEARGEANRSFRDERDTAELNDDDADADADARFTDAISGEVARQAAAASSTSSAPSASSASSAPSASSPSVLASSAAAAGAAAAAAAEASTDSQQESSARRPAVGRRRRGAHSVA